MLIYLLNSHLVASLWLLLFLAATYFADRPAEDVALDVYCLFFLLYLSGQMLCSGLDRLLGLNRGEA